MHWGASHLKENMNWFVVLSCLIWNHLSYIFKTEVKAKPSQLYRPPYHFEAFVISMENKVITELHKWQLDYKFNEVKMIMFWTRDSMEFFKFNKLKHWTQYYFPLWSTLTSIICWSQEMHLRLTPVTTMDNGQWYRVANCRNLHVNLLQIFISSLKIAWDIHVI